ncbi:MAG: hydrogenase [Pseudomonadota bacterium]
MSGTSPLIEALIETEHWPRLDAESVEGFIAGDGVRVLFLTGDPAKNLETNDVAVILPELARAFGGAFQPAVVDRSIEDEMRQRFEIWPTPSLIFLRGGKLIGSIPKVRDWDDYLERIRVILAGDAIAAE